MEKLENQEITNKLIDEMNSMLAKKRMFQKEIYENLIAKRLMKPNSEKEQETNSKKQKENTKTSI